jgi:acetyl esterase/lipase
MDRRTVLGLGVTAALARMTHRAFAEDMTASGVLSTDPTEIIPLWPGMPPGGEGVHLETKVVERSEETGVSFPDRFVNGIDKPTLQVFRPQKPDGSAVVVAPGGGYGSVAFDREGVDVARRLNASGVTVFVLRYRLPAEGWANAKDVPLQDVQRAMRIVRAGAQGFGVDPNRLGVFGSSAGGHLAASLATRYYDKVYEPLDNIDAQDAKPAFATLMYPVITMSEPGTHPGSRLALLGPNPSDAIVDRYSCEKLVSDKTSPCFICMVANDEVVRPMENGVAMFQALRAATVPVELHIFEEGKHGFGLRLTKGKPVSAWPDLFLHWGYSNGWFRDPSAMPG